MKKILSAIFALGFCLFGLTACGEDAISGNKQETVWNMKTVYAQAKELGYKGSLEEFIDTISGVDGEDGVGIKDVYINEQGELIVELTKGKAKNLGVIGGRVDEHEHIFDESVEIRKATCKQTGVILQICSDCGEGKYTIIDKLSEHNEHSFSNGTCTVCGEKVFVAKWFSPITGANLLNGYGFYYNATLNAYCEHTGIDLSASVGTNVCVVANGTVESIYKDDLLSGTEITVDHGNGLKTVYRFVNEVEGLTVGQTVNKGDIIATVAEANGNEYQDGSHLHFEVLENGANVNPELYVDISNWSQIY